MSIQINVIYDCSRSQKNLREKDFEKGYRMIFVSLYTNIYPLRGSQKRVSIGLHGFALQSTQANGVVSNFIICSYKGMSDSPTNKEYWKVFNLGNPMRMAGLKERANSLFQFSC